MTRSGNLFDWPRLVVMLALLIAVFLPRLVGLGTILTIDEPLWQSRGDTFIRAFATGRFEKTLVAGQPGVTTAWLVGLADRWNSLATDQAAIAIATGVLVLILTYFLVVLWGPRWGLVAGFIVALDPFLLAHSRVVHTDALLALFYLTSIVSLLTALEPLYHRQPVQKRYLLTSAILAAGAMLTKTFAVLLVPTTIFLMIAYAWRTKTRWQNCSRHFFLWIGTVILFIYLAWPALWLHADTVYTYITGRVALHAEGTRSLETTSRWWYYWRESIFRLTSLVTILFPITLIGFLSTRHQKMRRTVMWLLLAGIGYMLLLSSSADKSDRYILFTLVVITGVVVYGLRVLMDWLRLRLHLSRYVLDVFLVALVLWQAIDTAQLHPYYLAHFNQLYPVEANHKLGWGEGLEQAAAWITSQNQQASVKSYYHRVFDYFYDGPSDSLSYVDNSGGDYVVLYRSMFERGQGEKDTELLTRYFSPPTAPPVHTISINGLPYVWIFQNK